MTKTQDTQAPVTRAFKVRGGYATEVSADDDSLLADGSVPYDARHTVTMPTGERLVFYPQNSAVAWPIATTVVAAPKAFTQQDFKNMFGAYMVWLARIALTPPTDEGLAWNDIVVLVLSGLAAVAGVGAWVYADKGFHAAQAAANLVRHFVER